MAFKKGDLVRFTPPVIQGTVVQAAVNDEAELKLLVEMSPDANGHVNQIWFSPEQLAAVPEAAPAPAAS